MEINADLKRPHLTEYGVCFGKVGPFPGRPGQFYRDGTTTWFKDYELTFFTAPQRRDPGDYTASPSDPTKKAA